MVHLKYYKETHGERVYKLPVASIPLTCPNRDGSAGVGPKSSVVKSVRAMKIILLWMTIARTIRGKILLHRSQIQGEEKFIPYYQNFSNTYSGT